MSGWRLDNDTPGSIGINHGPGARNLRPAARDTPNLKERENNGPQDDQRPDREESGVHQRQVGDETI
jgi:hypothetical protein